MAPNPVWLINGASRGIGQEHARQAVQAGCTVLAACRTPSKATELQQLAKEHPGQVHLLTLDVTNEKSIEVKPLGVLALPRSEVYRILPVHLQMQSDIRNRLQPWMTGHDLSPCNACAGCSSGSC